jgi:hypothetical protein
MPQICSDVAVAILAMRAGGARMAVRLQTAEGEIKDYQTVYGVGCTPMGTDYYDYEKWVSKCGTEWHAEPEPHEECGHLECAIYKAEYERGKKTGGAFVAAIASVFFVIAVIARPNGIIGLVAVMFFVFLVAVAIWHLGVGLKAEENLDELTEYKDKGTINGIKAFQTFKDQEEAGAKHG